MRIGFNSGVIQVLILNKGLLSNNCVLWKSLYHLYVFSLPLRICDPPYFCFCSINSLGTGLFFY